MANFIDLTNQKYGKLLVLQRDGYDGSKKIMWLCKCDCGQIKRIRGNDLRSGKVVSCGCVGKQNRLLAQQEKNKNKLPSFKNDLTNKQFGRLKVLEFDLNTTQLKRETTTQKRSWWKCQCECGNIISVSSSQLLNGKTQSCGCLQKEKASQFMKEQCQPIGAKRKFIDLTDKTFGNLTVIKRADNNTPFNKPKWVCSCKCGSIIEVDGNSLRCGATKSCGCLGNSLGQDIIRNLLIKNNISFQQEVKFNNLKDQSYLRFDFSILDDEGNIIKLIEYDGRQHSDPTSIWHTEKVIKHDQMKNKYCKENNIPLLRISYKDIDKIDLNYLLNKITNFN